MEALPIPRRRSLEPRSFHMTESKTTRVRADFMGLFGELLCLSHNDTCEDANGNIVTLHAGMTLTAFDEDADEHGNRDDARIDRNGVRHESELQGGA